VDGLFRELGGKAEDVERLYPSGVLSGYVEQVSRSYSLWASGAMSGYVEQFNRSYSRWASGATSGYVE